MKNNEHTKEWYFEHSELTCPACKTTKKEERSLNFYLNENEDRKFQCSNEQCDFVEINTMIR